MQSSKIDADISVSIIAMGRSINNARLQRTLQSLVSGGLTVEVFATGLPSEAPRGIVFHPLRKKNRFERVYSSWLIPWRATGDVLFTTDPESVLSLFIIAKLRKKKWGVDVREDYLLLMKDRVWANGFQKFIAKCVAQIAVKISAKADLTVVVDDWIKPLQARNRVVIANDPDPSFLPEPTAAATSPTAIYIGDVRKSRGLWNMLGALEKAPKWKMVIIGDVVSGDLQKLETWRNTSKASSRVEFLGAMAPLDAWKYVEGVWVGLALLEETPAFLLAWPTKIGEYLACGLPVIATDLPRASAVLHSNGAGRLVTNESQVATSDAVSKILNSWVDNPSEFKKVKEQALESSEEWRTKAKYHLLPELFREMYS